MASIIINDYTKTKSLNQFYINITLRNIFSLMIEDSPSLQYT